jgi:hypothetical protein
MGVGVCVIVGVGVEENEKTVSRSPPSAASICCSLIPRARVPPTSAEN